MKWTMMIIIMLIKILSKWWGFKIIIWIGGFRWLILAPFHQRYYLQCAFSVQTAAFRNPYICKLLRVMESVLNLLPLCGTSANAEHLLCIIFCHPLFVTFIIIEIWSWWALKFVVRCSLFTLINKIMIFA